MSDRFTVVFKGDIRAFDGNPLHIVSPFGEVAACGEGDAFEAADTIEALRAENARIKESNLELQAKVEGIYNYLVEEKHENKRLREAGKEVVDWWLRDGMNEFEGAPASMFNLRAALGDE